MMACQLASVDPVPQFSSAASSSGASAAALLQLASEYTQRKIYVSNVGEELEPQKLYTIANSWSSLISYTTHIVRRV